MSYVVADVDIFYPDGECVEFGVSIILNEDPLCLEIVCPKEHEEYVLSKIEDTLSYVEEVKYTIYDTSANDPLVILLENASYKTLCKLFYHTFSLDE